MDRSDDLMRERQGDGFLTWGPNPAVEVPWQKIIMGVCIQGLLGSLPSKNNHRSAAPRMWRCALFSVTQVTMSCKTAQASLLQP